METAPIRFGSPEDVMRRAIAIAKLGEGHVEPNPMVGAVLVDSGLGFIAEGYHQQFGSAHAEVNAIAAAGGKDLSEATLFVTLEPCGHTGKTPPCSRAIVQAGIPRVVVGVKDPAPHTQSQGLQNLADAGIATEVGLLEAECSDLVAPFARHITTGMPWVIAKWAMTLDGRIASRTGHSQWISSPQSREIVHVLRGRMDAIIVGRGTVECDDPQLTARPAGPKTAIRVVVDRNATISLGSALVRTANDTPVMVFADPNAPESKVSELREHGVDVVLTDCSDLSVVLSELGKRGCTNVLVEGGGTLLGSFFDQELIDEVHAFIAPKLVGGAGSPGPVLGDGLDQIPALPSLRNVVVRTVSDDVYVSGRVDV